VYRIVFDRKSDIFTAFSGGLTCSKAKSDYQGVGEQGDLNVGKGASEGDGLQVHILRIKPFDKRYQKTKKP
jgi:hypothetical protein